uniref:Uncharacterized protein n=1 Tax=Catharus ustulatus TaxID=91951 RepID=A0A8C3XZ36_CATUS
SSCCSSPPPLADWDSSSGTGCTESCAFPSCTESCAFPSCTESCAFPSCTESCAFPSCTESCAFPSCTESCAFPSCTESWELGTALAARAAGKERIAPHHPCSTRCVICSVPDVPEYPHRSAPADPGAQGLVLNHAAATLCPTALQVTGTRDTCHLPVLGCASPAREHPCRSRWPAPVPTG